MNYNLHMPCSIFVACEKDIVFVLDNSDFLTSEQFKTNLLFVTNMVDRLFNFGSRFAIVYFNEKASLHINFGQYSDIKDELQTVVS